MKNVNTCCIHQNKIEIIVGKQYELIFTWVKLRLVGQIHNLYVMFVRTVMSAFLLRNPSQESQMTIQHRRQQMMMVLCSSPLLPASWLQARALLKEVDVNILSAEIHSLIELMSGCKSLYFPSFPAAAGVFHFTSKKFAILCVCATE